MEQASFEIHLVPPERAQFAGPERMAIGHEDK